MKGIAPWLAPASVFFVRDCAADRTDPRTHDGTGRACGDCSNRPPRESAGPGVGRAAAQTGASEDQR